MNCRLSNFDCTTNRANQIRGATRNRARGFSFTEIMFAVIILGVGFIMVAAIFPVAIQQAKNTNEETTAAAIARGAATYLSGVLKDGATPASTSNCPPDLGQTTHAV